MSRPPVKRAMSSRLPSFDCRARTVRWTTYACGGMGRASARGSGRTNSTTTITDVARLADVSPTTLSRVLNGGYPFSPDTPDRVARGERELSYVRNATAQWLAVA